MWQHAVPRQSAASDPRRLLCHSMRTAVCLRAAAFAQSELLTARNAAGDWLSALQGAAGIPSPQGLALAADWAAANHVTRALERNVTKSAYAAFAPHLRPIRPAKPASLEHFQLPSRQQHLSMRMCRMLAHVAPTPVPCPSTHSKTLSWMSAERRHTAGSMIGVLRFNIIYSAAQPVELDLSAVQAQSGS